LKVSKNGSIVLFNSLEFLLFLPVVFAAYWILNQWTGTRAGLRAQNLLVLAASYVFYGWWDWRFLSLIAFSTLVDYAVGLRIAKANAAELAPDAPEEARSEKAKRWLFVSLAVNLGLLGYFKYANFFIESWVDAWAAAGVTMHASTLQIILPVGISFYTFQTLSYSIDIYRRRLEPSKDFIAFAAFVSFFPQLVAGPIERASALLPQITKRRQFDYDLAVSGMRLILWGMFKKVVVADTCAIYVNDIFANYEQYSGPTLILGAIYFAFQIYGDFSGYSDIAIGTARLFGIRLMTNFRTPYFSRDIAEFWRRWHISLSTWFRDYLYIPLGGSRVGKWKAVRNTFIIFLVSGFWHGANWTFVAWGFIHACLFLPLLLLGRNRRNTGDIQGLPSWRELAGMAWTFAAVMVAWVFFRAANVNEALQFLFKMTQTHDRLIGHTPDWRHGAAVLFIVLAAEFVQKWNQFDNLWNRGGMTRVMRWMAYSGVIWLCLKSYTNQSDFIYFQF
jgi:D-alanyl-lipoteichoic acid acyltransferase DltB (MBOAT superfamily)